MTDTSDADQRSAGIVSRFIAAVLDVVVVMSVLGAGYLATAFVLFTMDISNFAFPQVGWWFTTTGFLAVAFGYLTLCWAASGRTIGAVMMGLLVVRRSGKRLHFAQAALRGAACVLFPIGLFWVAVSDKRLSLQDVALRTRVIYHSE